MTTQTVGRAVCLPVLVLTLLVTAGLPAAHAEVISGTITNWAESGPVMAIGDGVNDVHAWWSFNSANKGWFYGAQFTGDSDVAHAVGATNVADIFDASMFDFTGAISEELIGPLCDADCDPDRVGEFVIWRNQQGYYAVLRIDDIFFENGEWFLNARWWFQTDGTSNFSPVVCDIQLSQSTYSNGEPVDLTVFRFANVGGYPVAVEYKVSIEVPSGEEFVVRRGGADGSLTLPTGFDGNWPFSFFTVQPATPRGKYRLVCRFVNPVTGKTQTQDINPFTVQ